MNHYKNLFQNYIISTLRLLLLSDKVNYATKCLISSSVLLLGGWCAVFIGNLAITSWFITPSTSVSTIPTLILTVSVISIPIVSIVSIVSWVSTISIVPVISAVPVIPSTIFSIVPVISWISPAVPSVILSIVSRILLIHWTVIIPSTLRVRSAVTVLSVTHFAWVTACIPWVSRSVVLPCKVPGFPLVSPLTVVHPRWLVTVPRRFALVLVAAHGWSAVVHSVVERWSACEVTVEIPLSFQAGIAPCNFDFQLLAFEFKLFI